jgi:hypothetical protein
MNSNDPNQAYAPSITYTEGTREQVVNVPFWQALYRALFVWAMWFTVLLTAFLLALGFSLKYDPSFAGEWWWLGLILVVCVPFMLSAVDAVPEFDERLKKMHDWLEKVTNRDLDHDGHIGSSEAVIHSQVTDLRGNGNRGDIRDGKEFLLILDEYAHDPDMKWGIRDIELLGVGQPAWTRIIADMTELGLLEPKYPGNPQSISILTDAGIEWMDNAITQRGRVRVELSGVETYADNFSKLQTNALDVTTPPLLDFANTRPNKAYNNKQQPGRAVLTPIDRRR